MLRNNPKVVIGVYTIGIALFSYMAGTLDIVKDVSKDLGVEKAYLFSVAYWWLIFIIVLVFICYNVILNRLDIKFKVHNAKE